MVDFEQMLDNLMQVERTGFNPYTQAYSAALEPSNDLSGTQQPFGGESGLKESSRVPMVDTTSVNTSQQQIPHPKQGVGDNYYDNVLSSHKDVPFVKRMLEEDTSSIQVKGEKYRSSHLMSQVDNYVIPKVQKENGELKYYEDYNKALRNAIKNKNYIKFDTVEEAEDFAKNYKDSKIWQKYENSSKW